MQTFDAKKLFLMGEQFDQYQAVNIHYEDIKKFGTKVKLPPIGFKQSGVAELEPYIEFFDGQRLVFPNVPQNHEALTKLSEIYAADDVLSQIELLQENNALTQKDVQEFKKAQKTLISFQKQYS